MCGRFASFREAQDLADEFAIARVAEDARVLAPSWNVAPTDPVRIVVERPGPSGAERSLRVARWGLVPSWSRDSRGGARMINARSESLDDRRAFAGPLGSRRCLVVADGYYEWRAPRGGGRGPKQPYFITGDATLALAGLFDFWRDPGRDPDDPDRWLVTTTIVTTRARHGLERIHDRMPVALDPASWDRWLAPGVGAREAMDLLTGRTAPMSPVAVSRAVGSVARNGPGLIEPVVVAPEPVEVDLLESLSPDTPTGDGPARPGPVPAPRVPPGR